MKMHTSTVMKQLSTATVGAALIALGTAGSAAAASLYSITNLGILDFQVYNYSVANDINNNGQVVGRSVCFGYECKYHSGAFIWENGAMTWLPGFSISHSTGSTNAYYSEAVAINDAGAVVGVSSGFSPSNQMPYFFGKGGGSFLLPPGSRASIGNIANDINNAGEIVGTVEVGSFSSLPRCGFLVDSDRTYINFSGNDFSCSSSANGINDLGQVVGTFSGGGYLWDRQNDTVTSLNFAPSKINNKGQVVGGSTLWANGRTTNLGTLGGNSSGALDINELGQVIGFSLTSSGAKQGFLWENGAMFNLNSLLPTNSGWEILEARAINDLGQIVGTGLFNGQQRAFLMTALTPPQPQPQPESVPEPVSVLGLFAFGAFGAGAMLKRQQQR